MQAYAPGLGIPSKRQSLLQKTSAPKIQKCFADIYVSLEPPRRRKYRSIRLFLQAGGGRGMMQGEVGSVRCLQNALHFLCLLLAGAHGGQKRLFSAS